MNKDSPEYKRVQKQVALTAAGITEQDIEDVSDGSNYWQQMLNKADAILAVQGIAILADDQTSPKIHNQAVYTESNRMTERAFRKANFRRVI